MRCINLLLFYFVALDSTAISPSVLVLFPEYTVGCMRRDILVFAFVVSLIPFAVGCALVFALLAAFCFCARVFCTGASTFAVILTASLRLLYCFAFLLVDAATTCLSTLGDACMGTLGTCCVTDPMGIVCHLVGSVICMACVDFSM